MLTVLRRLKEQTDSEWGFHEIMLDKFQDKFLGQIGMRIMQRPQGRKQYKTKEELNEFMAKMFIENVWCFGPETDLFKNSRVATLEDFF